MRRRATAFALGIWLAAAVGCAGSGAGRRTAGPGTGDVPPPTPTPTADLPEATSLLGRPLFRPALAPETARRLEADLIAARAAYDAAPDVAENMIWLGRRTAYLGRYREAIEIYSDGIRRFPDEPRLYRHRGHRYITVRRLDDAIRDLTRAAELVRGRPDQVEPDGAPNPAGIPRSTLQSNIWYHLGLAHYLKHDFESALAAYLECMKVSANDDMLVATADWLYMTYRRLGRERDAAQVLERIRPHMEILENHSYHRRLLMYKGLLPPDSLLAVGDDADPVTVATQGYGVGNWHLYNGRSEEAFEVFRMVLGTSNWAAFGYIAAEAELAAGPGA